MFHKLLLLAVAAAVIAKEKSLADDVCSINTRVFSFAVRNIRNATGHHHVTTDVVLPTSKGRKSKSLEEFGLEVTQSDCSTPTANYVRLTTELIVPERRVPPPEYQLVPGVGWYRLYLAPLTWGKARLACEADGAHLAVLNSKQEAAALKEIYAKTPGSTPTEAFIGFSDLIEGQYRTIFGDTLEDAGFKEWHTEQPNNYGGNQNCGAFTKDEGKLNDWECADTQPYFCEFEL
ncbi:hypothetical protein R5R35_002179 [Gryllus longicercus]|uniref:C-type lectin domain-containing protein n=1 Tax=Gryllus longicercus TaxID=2509291 RepID=A0AAN9YVA5_9ORTH